MQTIMHILDHAFIIFYISFFLFSFDYLHKRQSGGRGEYGRVMGVLEVRICKLCGFQENPLTS